MSNIRPNCTLPKEIKKHAKGSNALILDALLQVNIISYFQAQEHLPGIVRLNVTGTSTWPPAHWLRKRRVSSALNGGYAPLSLWDGSTKSRLGRRIICKDIQPLASGFLANASPSRPSYRTSLILSPTMVKTMVLIRY